MKIRKKPLLVEAVQWTGKNAKEVKAWIAEVQPSTDHFPIAIFVPKRSMSKTLWQNVADPEWSDEITAALYNIQHETYVGMKDRDWVICGTGGEFYPLDRDTILKTYDLPEGVQ